jgi:hypothetical protein
MTSVWMRCETGVMGVAMVDVLLILYFLLCSLEWVYGVIVTYGVENVHSVYRGAHYAHLGNNKVVQRTKSVSFYLRIIRR